MEVIKQWKFLTFKVQQWLYPTFMGSSFTYFLLTARYLERYAIVATACSLNKDKK